MIALGEVGVDRLGDAVLALREMHHDGLAVQLHPGDLGWHWRFGAKATAAAVRTWSRDGEILAVALLDGPTLLRCLVAYDGRGFAVAAATVWSAGPGRPGLLEPVGVHHGHRGRRHGTAITVAAAAALRDMGCSSATVCTKASNAAAVATYESAGFRRLPDVHDLRRSI